MSGYPKVQEDDHTSLLQIVATNLLIALAVLEPGQKVPVTDRTTLLQIIAKASIDLANGGGGGGGTAWGAITGTLPNQTDLQNALDAKGNLATTNVWTDTNTFNNGIDGSGSWVIMPDGSVSLAATKFGVGTSGDLKADDGAIQSDGAGGLQAVSFSGLLTPVAVPTSSADPGQPGQYSFDADYFYWYVLGDGWRRSSGSSF